MYDPCFGKSRFNTLQNKNMLGLSKFKMYAEDSLNVTKMEQKRVENIEEKQENTGYNAGAQSLVNRT